MLNRVLKEVRMPFPDGFFPDIVLSPELQNRYHHTAYQLLNATLRDEAPLTRFHPAQQPSNWKLIGERQGLQLYRERGAERGSAVQVITIGSVPGTLEDVMWGLYAANHRSVKTQRAILHSDYLDAAMLRVLEDDPCGEDDPGFTFRFTGLKWLACAANGKLLHKRDVCWHEELGLMHDANGDEVGFLTMHSVRLKECPPLEQQGVKRSSIAVAYVFRNLGHGRTSVYMQGSHTVGGKARSWSTDAAMAELWLAMANVLDCAQAKRLTKLLAVRDTDAVVAYKSSRVTCDMCDQKLKLLKSGQPCKICSKNVCDRCRLTKLVYPTSDAVAFPCSYVFCKRCIVDVSDELHAATARVSLQSDLSSYRSGSPRHRAASTEPRSVYSSSSAASSSNGSYRSAGAGGVRRDRVASQPQPQSYSRSKQLLSPRSSASTSASARATTLSSESSFSDHPVSSLSSSCPRPESLLSSSAPHQVASRLRAPSATTASTGSFGAGALRVPIMRRAVSQSSAIPQPPRLQTDRSGVDSVASAFEVNVIGHEPESSSVSLSSSSSGLSESDDDEPQQPLSPTSAVRAKLRQIEAFADDETGLVQLPPPLRRLSSQPSVSTAVVTHSAGRPDDRFKYSNTYQTNRDGSLSLRSGASAPADRSPGIARSGSYVVHGSPQQPQRSGSTSTSASEREQIMQRLMQINMSAEAAYHMARHNHGSMSESTRR